MNFKRYLTYCLGLETQLTPSTDMCARQYSCMYDIVPSCNYQDRFSSAAGVQR